jgi:hypothetical protein
MTLSLGEHRWNCPALYRMPFFLERMRNSLRGVRIVLSQANKPQLSGR